MKLIAVNSLCLCDISSSDYRNKQN